MPKCDETKCCNVNFDSSNEANGCTVYNAKDSSMFGKYELKHPKAIKT